MHLTKRDAEGNCSSQAVGDHASLGVIAATRITKRFTLHLAQLESLFSVSPRDPSSAGCIFLRSIRVRVATTTFRPLDGMNNLFRSHTGLADKKARPVTGALGPCAVMSEG